MQNKRGLILMLLCALTILRTSDATSQGSQPVLEHFNEEYITYYSGIKWDDFLALVGNKDKDKVKILLTMRDKSIFDPVKNHDEDYLNEMSKNEFGEMVENRLIERNNYLKEYLGGDLYEDLLVYQETLEERALINRFVEQKLEGTESESGTRELAKDADKKNLLTEKLHNAKAHSDFNDDPTVDTRKNRPSQLAPLEYEYVLLYDQYIEAAKGILTDQELKEFKLFLKDQVDAIIYLRKNMF